MLGLRRRITMRVLDMLRRHERPWRLEYRPDPNYGQPRNVRTGGLYRGVNPLLLNSAAQRHGYLSCWWGTQRDWHSVGVTVPDTARGVIAIVYPKKGGLNDLNEELVFNADALQGTDKYRVTIKECVLRTSADPTIANPVIHGAGADIRVGVGDEDNSKDYCGYIYPSPYNKWPHHEKGDYILLPRMKPLAGLGIAEFLCNVFHELIHWAEIRTNFFDRLSCTELVAEIGCYYLTQECKVPPDTGLGHYSKWRERWIKWIDDEDTLIFRLAAQARRATDYVLSRTQRARNNSHYHDPDPVFILPCFPKGEE